ncbi:hypothetical protein NQ314_005770 [Rhamnusium bicolor]|uniref:Uncharacterized protein n=1 Tax=Rhamnusium bicolor TaxID=1586634 RepID=A0AAV8ZEM3_9CUCU|nr:hypothetical protein NQ314_005770 [Rhamnusium bicolor]
MEHIVLMATVNSNYEFIMVDAGIKARILDKGVLSSTPFGKAFSEEKLKIPEPNTLPNNDKKLPFVFFF